jgi:hypothetical protein
MSGLHGAEISAAIIGEHRDKRVSRIVGDAVIVRGLGLPAVDNGRLRARCGQERACCGRDTACNTPLCED